MTIEGVFSPARKAREKIMVGVGLGQRWTVTVRVKVGHVLTGAVRLDHSKSDSRFSKSGSGS